MNVLNQLFDKIYVISSFSTQNRISDLVGFLNNEDIKHELIIAPKKKYFGDYNDENLWVGKGAFSLLSANESIFLKEFHIKSNTFCILEDDIFFDSNYKNKLLLLKNELPTDWEIFNLGYHEHTPINSKLNNKNICYKLEKVDEIVGTHIVAYKNNTVSFLIDNIEVNKLPMDWFLNKKIYSNFNSYMNVDKIFYASSFRDYELNKTVSYKKYKSEIC